MGTGGVRGVGKDRGEGAVGYHSSGAERFDKEVRAAPAAIYYTVAARR